MTTRVRPLVWTHHLAVCLFLPRGSQASSWPDTRKGECVCVPEWCIVEGPPFELLCAPYSRLVPRESLPTGHTAFPKQLPSDLHSLSCKDTPLSACTCQALCRARPVFPSPAPTGRAEQAGLRSFFPERTFRSCRTGARDGGGGNSCSCRRHHSGALRRYLSMPVTYRQKYRPL